MAQSVGLTTATSIWPSCLWCLLLPHRRGLCLHGHCPSTVSTVKHKFCLLIPGCWGLQPGLTLLAHFRGKPCRETQSEALQCGWLREAKSPAPSHTACSSVAVRRLALVCGSSLLLGLFSSMVGRRALGLFLLGLALGSGVGAMGLVFLGHACGQA